MFLALREFKHAKVRYLLISLIMILIAWLVLFVSGLANGLSSDNASSIKNMKPDYLVLQKEADQRINRSALNDGLVTDIREFTERHDTESALLSIQMATLTKPGTSKKIDAAYFGIEGSGLLQPQITEGKVFTNESVSEIVVDQSLKNEGFSLGDSIIDEASGKKLKITGFTKNQSFSHSPVVHMNMNTLLSVKNENTIHAIALNSDKKTAVQVENNFSEIEAVSKSRALKGIPGYQEEQGSLLMMIVFLFIIAAFVLAVFFYVITIQKISQFGVLKAIGAKTSYLAKNIIFQVMFLSSVSLLISITLTFTASLVLPDNFPFDLSPFLILVCSLLFLTVALLGSLLSLFKVAKIDAVDAIGRAV
jgi:putative ABC transport system permease protein